MTESDTPRVWIGCLGCYNGGNLVGEWTDAGKANDFEEHFTERVKVPRSHIVEAHEELWCMDFENFRGLLKGECSPAEAQRLADLIAAIEADHVDVQAVVEWMGWTGETVTEWDAPTESAFRDAFRGEWPSEKEFAYEDVTELGFAGLAKVPEELLPYLDMDMVTEVVMQDYNAEPTGKSDGSIYIFWAH